MDKKILRQNLIVQNINLVYDRVFKIKTNCNKEYLLSIGFIGLINGIDTFDINSHQNFYSYLIQSIDDEIKKEIEFYKTQERLLYTNKDENTYKIVRKVISNLPDKYKKVILMYFGFMDRTYTQQEIADELGVTQTYISRLIKCILKKIKIELEQLGVYGLPSKQKRIL